MKYLLAGILLLACVAAAPATMPTVGVEGKIELALPGTLLQGKPVTHKAPLLLRVASTQPAARPDDLWYDLRFIGLVPGAHDLKDYLIRADGSSTADLPAIPVAVVGLLPEDHQGQLAQTRGAAWPFFGGYQYLIIAMVVLWLALLFPLLLVGRKRRAKAAAPPPVRRTFADRIRPLIDQATRGTLSAEEKGKLERMLLSYWQQRLELTGDSPADAMAALRRHPEAGELLRALEEWLHRRPGAGKQIHIDALLRPYRDVPDPGAAREPIAVPVGAGGAA